MGFKKSFGLERPPRHQLAYVLGLPKTYVEYADLQPFTSYYLQAVVEGVSCRLILEITRRPPWFLVLRSSHPGIAEGQRGFLRGSCEGNQIVEETLRDDLPQMIFLNGLTAADEGAHWLISHFYELRVLHPTGWGFLGSDNFADVDFQVSALTSLESLNCSIEDARRRRASLAA